MRILKSKWHILVCLIITLIAYVPMFNAFAESSADIPKPKSNYSDETRCVEPVAIMRKQHFEYILEHRDKTVIEGIRTTQYSLIACIDCHITPNAEGEFARYSDDTHFCASCHQFTAVNIDCFQCHADRPEEAIRKARNPNTTVNAHTQEIHEYLQLGETQPH